MKSRDLALVAILLAVGTVIYAFTPNLGVMTPDTVASFAVLAILLVRPKLSAGLGIGIVAVAALVILASRRKKTPTLATREDKNQSETPEKSAQRTM